MGRNGRRHGGLDLEGCTLPHDLYLYDCRFDEMPLFQGAAAKTIGFDGSVRESGVEADRLAADGSVFLRRATVTGAVRLLGSTLGVSLYFNEGMFTASDVGNDAGQALIADGLNAKGGVFLHGAKVTGAVRLLGATLGGSLICIGGGVHGVGRGR